MAAVVAVLLAAGESSRMGRPKALLSWGRDTLIGHQVRALKEAGVSRIIVVLGHAAEEVVPHVRDADSVETHINPHYVQGKTTSIKVGLREVGPEAETILLLAVDQPRPVELVRLLLQKHADAGALITQPLHQGRRGHPVLFDASLLPELLEITEENLGIREVMEQHHSQVHKVAVESPIALLDFNTEEEYQRAWERYGLAKTLEGPGTL